MKGTGQSILEASVSLAPISLCLKGAIAGKTLPFYFKNVGYRICFPMFEQTQSGDFQPTLKGTKVKLNWIDPKNNRRGHDIGSVVSYMPNIAVSEFSVSSLIVQSRQKITTQQGSRANLNLVLWSKSFIAWIEALTDKDLGSKSMSVEQDTTVEAYMIKPVQFRRIKKRKDSATITLNIPSPIDVRLVRKALKFAASGSLPPEAYILLASGRKHMTNKRYREALFDASTSVELAMSDMLRTKILTTNPMHVNKLMERYQQISGLTDGLMTLGIPVPYEVKVKVGTPRNKAIHNNMPIHFQDATDALDVASRFLRRFQPIT